MELIILDGMGCAYHFSEKRNGKWDREYFEKVLRENYPTLWNQFINGNELALDEAEALEYSNEHTKFVPIISDGLQPLLNSGYRIVWAAGGAEKLSREIQAKLNVEVPDTVGVNVFGGKKKMEAWYKALEQYKGMPIRYVIEDSEKNLMVALEACKKLSTVEPLGVLICNQEFHRDNSTGYYKGTLKDFANFLINNFI